MVKGFLVIIFVSYSAFAQISASGTVVVIDRTKDRIVVAADSLLLLGFGSTNIERNYNYCKIAAFRHKFVFASAGSAEYFGMNPLRARWSNAGVAKDAVKYAGENGTVETVARSWELRILMNWLFEYRRDPNAVRAIAAKTAGILAQGYWAADDGTAHADQFSSIILREYMPIPIIVVNSTNGRCLGDCGFAGHNFCTLGYFDMIAQMCFTHTPQGIAWRKTLEARSASDSRIASDFVDISERMDREDLGGAIDSVELTHDHGVHWLSKKDNCPENQD